MSRFEERYPAERRVVTLLFSFGVITDEVTEA